MKTMKTLPIATCSMVLSIASAANASVMDGVASDAHWPSFRGPAARGIAQGMTPPTSWDIKTGDQVRWKTPIPGLSHSSPIVWGDAVYVTTAVMADGESELSSLYGSPGYGAGDSVEDEGPHAFRLYCLDKRSGHIRWQRDAAVGTPKVKRHPKSSHANPTPACDADRIVAFFGSEGLYCYSHDGDLQWSVDLGILNSGAPGYPDKDGYQWGFASSPILHGNRVIVQCDVENQSFIAAFDATTGVEIWRVDREEDSTWGTPTVYTAPDGTECIAVNGYKHMGAYDLDTGAEVWTMANGGDVPVPTPIVVDGLIYITNAHGRMRPLCAIRTDATGELTLDAEAHDEVVWCHPRQGVYMQTPIVIDGRLYSCSDGGILACHDARTGERLYRERLGSGTSGFSGSAVAVGTTMFLSGEDGQIHVIRAGATFERLGTNDMGETCMATPAISDGCLYIRTRHHLVALGEPIPTTTP